VQARPPCIAFLGAWWPQLRQRTSLRSALLQLTIASSASADSGQAVQARFNFPGQTQGLFCAQHAQDGMRNVMHKPCAAEGCPLQAVFNKEGESRGIYCSRHKEEGMARPMRSSAVWVPERRRGLPCDAKLALRIVRKR